MAESKLNSAQQEAVEHVDGPLMIVAGAGTGKTTVVAQKIKFLIDNGLAKPTEILALTFNEKAAAEMQDRVDSLMDRSYLDIEISTFHSFCQRLLEQYGLDIGLPNYFKILTPTDVWIMMSRRLHEFNLDYYRPLGNPTRHLHELIRHFAKCKDEMISPQEYLEYAENVTLDKDKTGQEEKTRLTEVANAYHTYNRLLLKHGTFDFADLIYYANILLSTRPNVLSKLQSRFKYILVDEFQDVNWAQYELVKKLASAGAQLTVVGDDDQSIYAFRGASVANILRFRDDYPNAKQIVLTENYRSDQSILDKAYELIQGNNPDRLETKLHINKALVYQGAATKKGAGSQVVHVHRAKAQDEARFIADEIKRLKNIDPEAGWNDFSVLVRANNHADMFASEFEHSQIPYEFLAAAGLYRQPIVLDCINFLKLVDSYHESSAIYRLLRLPHLDFKESDLQKLTFFARSKKSISYYEALKRTAEYDMSEQGKQLCESLIIWIHEGMKNSRAEKPTQIIFKFFDSSGYLKYLTTGEENGDRNITRQIFHLNQFLSYIANYESLSPGATASDFLEYFEQVLEAGDLGLLKQPEDTPDSVNIMTIHTAKGLEYKYVFVVNLVEDRFPTRRHGNEAIEVPAPLIKEVLPEGDAHIEEERRLFYVAMTRAKNRLYLTSADDYGGAREKKISRFLSELGYAKTEKKDADNQSAIVDYSSPPKSEESAEFVFPIPKKFSYSQIQTYRECPYRYKLSCILKLPSESSPSLTFGSVIHTTLERFYKRLIELNSATQDMLFTRPNQDASAKVSAPAFDELISIYNDSWRSDGYSNTRQKEEFFEKGKTILSDFYKKNTDHWSVPMAVEARFTIALGENAITGKIDRIDKNNSGEIVIYDYKTGKSKEKLETDDKDQLIIYQLAVMANPDLCAGGHLGALVYIYLNDGSELAFIGTEKDLQKISDKITETIAEIKRLCFDAKPEKHKCSKCEFRNICDYRE
jgi:DNA helicase II / ATP-dependent DNA helicase PcrA